MQMAVGSTSPAFCPLLVSFPAAWATVVLALLVLLLVVAEAFSPLAWGQSVRREKGMHASSAQVSSLGARGGLSVAPGEVANFLPLSPTLEEHYWGGVLLSGCPWFGFWSGVLLSHWLAHGLSLTAPSRDIRP